jgi:hypothetical protein
MKILHFQIPRCQGQNLQVQCQMKVMLIQTVHILSISSHYLTCKSIDYIYIQNFFVLTVSRPPRPQVFLPSYNGTPRITPSGSPPRVSPPRRHSISVTSMNTIFNDRSSAFSGHHSSPFDATSQTG